jgi:hypothetical protein
MLGGFCAPREAHPMEEPVREWMLEEIEDVRSNLALYEHVDVESRELARWWIEKRVGRLELLAEAQTGDA